MKIKKIYIGSLEKNIGIENLEISTFSLKIIDELNFYEKVNIISSEKNNKGKTLINESIMYSLGLKSDIMREIYGKNKDFENIILMIETDKGLISRTNPISHEEENIFLENETKYEIEEQKTYSFNGEFFEAINKFSSFISNFPKSIALKGNNTLIHELDTSTLDDYSSMFYMSQHRNDGSGGLVSFEKLNSYPKQKTGNKKNSRFLYLARLFDLLSDEKLKELKSSSIVLFEAIKEDKKYKEFIDHYSINSENTVKNLQEVQKNMKDSVFYNKDDLKDIDIEFISLKSEEIKKIRQKIIKMETERENNIALSEIFDLLYSGISVEKDGVKFEFSDFILDVIHSSSIKIEPHSLKKELLAEERKLSNELKDYYIEKGISSKVIDEIKNGALKIENYYEVIREKVLSWNYNRKEIIKNILSKDLLLNSYEDENNKLNINSASKTIEKQINSIRENVLTKINKEKENIKNNMMKDLKIDIDDEPIITESWNENLFSGVSLSIYRLAEILAILNLSKVTIPFVMIDTPFTNEMKSNSIHRNITNYLLKKLMNHKNLYQIFISSTDEKFIDENKKYVVPINYLVKNKEWNRNLTDKIKTKYPRTFLDIEKSK